MMWRKILFASVLLCPWSGITHAVQDHYVASASQSRWQLTQQPKIACQLAHDIPAYGRAVFASYAGKRLNMRFTLDMWLKPDAVTDAVLISQAPLWQPGYGGREIARLQYQEYFHAELPKRSAWIMLNELGRGREPTFYYQDWYDASRQVAVGLSAANFASQYRQFKTCLANLLPYSFDDIAFTVLNFKAGGTELTDFSKQQLARVQEYLRYAPQIELILLDGYTDSYGSRSANKQVSLRRTSAVKDFFVAQGINQERILTSGHGENRLIGPNDTAQSRALNRRVVVRISQ
ncbi:smf-dependent flagellar motor protein MotY [Shewanella sp. NFH-SH190041]|nr:smf-dependent flagellar motor protein MotY [Shewanella sp. NFH-SH190041]